MMKRGDKMLESAFLLLMNSLLLMLRVSPGDSFPKPLGRAEEQDCLQRWAAGDLEARNRLVEHNLRLVAHIIKKYYTQTEDIDDLISIGTIGLIKAVETYQPAKSIKLATYASRCIENVNITQWRKTGKPVLAACLERREEKRRVFCTLGDGAFLMTKTFLQRIFAPLFICSFPLRCGRRRRGVRNTGTAALAQSEKPRCAV